MLLVKPIILTIQHVNYPQIFMNLKITKIPFLGTVGGSSGGEGAIISACGAAFGLGSKLVFLNQ